MDVRNGRWLLVLDNADDMNMFYPIDTSTVQEGGEEVYLINYLPSNSKGSILITTKDTTAGRSLANGREPIVIRPMTPDEGKDMLLSRAPSIQSDNCVEKLLTELEYIPLAISQAAAFIRENNIKASQYLKLIHDNEASILDRGFYDWRRDPETPNSVTRTWSLSFDLIRKRNSYAIHLLSLMSVLDRQGIPRTLFDSEGVDEADLIIAFGTLQAFSLISVDKVGATFEMHRLVELSTRKWLDHQSALVHWQEKALSLLAGKFPIGHYESWVACEALISHAQIVLTYDFETRDSRLDYASLLRTVAAFDWRQGRYGPAEDKLRRALDEREKTLGQDHQDTLTTSHELANVLSDLGKFENAEVIYRRLLKEYEEAHGENHHWTLRLVNNLGLLFRDQGKYEQAEEMLWRALKGNENTLGKNHRSTLASVDNLAIVFADQGKYEQAEEMQLRAMKGRENMLGKDHPLMLNSVANLAVMFRKQGKYEQAEKLNWRALKGKEKTLGKDHRETLISVANLACLFADQGKYEEAEEMNWRALNEREKVLGKNHPDTLMSVSNLAVLFDKQGKYEQAGEMYQLALDKREKILGKDHPDTLHSAYRLGRFYDLYNKYNEASSLLQRACEGLQNRLGAEHPKTLACQQYCAERIRRREQQTHGESNVS
jgi:tetratricopeptide (TPR) repeat protein